MRPIVGAEGKETGVFEVATGGGRFRALELLVKQRRMKGLTTISIKSRRGAKNGTPLRQQLLLGQRTGIAVAREAWT